MLRVCFMVGGLEKVCLFLWLIYDTLVHAKPEYKLVT